MFKEQEFFVLPISTPPMLEEAFGYPGRANRPDETLPRFVAFYWTPYGDEAAFTDGQRSATGMMNNDISCLCSASCGRTPSSRLPSWKFGYVCKPLACAGSGRATSLVRRPGSHRSACSSAAMGRSPAGGCSTSSQECRKVGTAHR